MKPPARPRLPPTLSLEQFNQWTQWASQGSHRPMGVALAHYQAAHGAIDTAVLQSLAHHAGHSKGVPILEHLQAHGWTPTDHDLKQAIKQHDGRRALRLLEWATPETRDAVKEHRGHTSVGLPALALLEDLPDVALKAAELGMRDPDVLTLVIHLHKGAKGGDRSACGQLLPAALALGADPFHENELHRDRRWAISRHWHADYRTNATFPYALFEAIEKQHFGLGLALLELGVNPLTPDPETSLKVPSALHLLVAKNTPNNASNSHQVAQWTAMVGRLLTDPVLREATDQDNRQAIDYIMDPAFRCPPKMQEAFREAQAQATAADLMRAIDEPAPGRPRRRL